MPIMQTGPALDIIAGPTVEPGFGEMAARAQSRANLEQTQLVTAANQREMQSEAAAQELLQKSSGPVNPQDQKSPLSTNYAAYLSSIDRDPRVTMSHKIAAHKQYDANAQTQELAQLHKQYLESPTPNEEAYVSEGIANPYIGLDVMNGIQSNMVKLKDANYDWDLKDRFGRSAQLATIVENLKDDLSSPDVNVQKAARLTVQHSAAQLKTKPPQFSADPEIDAQVADEYINQNKDPDKKKLEFDQYMEQQKFEEDKRYHKEFVEATAINRDWIQRQKEEEVRQKEESRQDALESRSEQFAASLRGDPSATRAEKERDEASDALGNLMRAEEAGKVVDPLDYRSVLSKIYEDLSPEQLDKVTQLGSVDLSKVFQYIFGTKAKGTNRDIQRQLIIKALEKGQDADRKLYSYYESRKVFPSGLHEDRKQKIMNIHHGASFADLSGTPSYTNKTGTEEWKKRVLSASVGKYTQKDIDLARKCINDPKASDAEKAAAQSILDAVGGK
jgi:hypothetical protein